MGGRHLDFICRCHESEYWHRCTKIFLSECHVWVRCMFCFVLFFKLWCLDFVYRCLTLKIKAASKNMISEVEVKARTGMPLNQNASRSIQAVTLAVIAWEPLFIKPVRPAYVKTLLSSQCPLPKKKKQKKQLRRQHNLKTQLKWLHLLVMRGIKSNGQTQACGEQIKSFIITD